MANVQGGRSGDPFGDRKRSRNHVVEQLDPASGWTEDSDHHYLLVDLPGFKKEEVKLQVLDSGEILTSGERQVNENEYIYFKKILKVPEDSDLKTITGKFNGEILHVTVAKKAKEKKKSAEDEREKGKPGFPLAENSNRSEEEKKDEKGGDLPPENVEKIPTTKASVRRSAGTMARRHRGIIVTALVAFTLGVLVSHKIKLSHLTLLDSSTLSTHNL